ncbi:Phospholipid-transporting ATPase 2 [Phytophthora cinnamomi]|uniref:Phospholipid-transporting ATPase 2 n=1 Tax=Phytophthora cinnamomi TaxID=4785 RepID=UPI00355A37EC|nr:Phospholipid-transporting ATPase 2 [Phytophthora cinnamomi]
MDPLMHAFIVAQPPPKPLQHQQPQDALMVVDNHQLQICSAFNGWPQPPQDPKHHGAAATLMELMAAIGEETPATHLPKRVFKKRKATHTIRKEQKAALEKEIEALQARLEEIKLQALMQQDEATKPYHDRAVENAVLRESIQEHLVVAQVRTGTRSTT